MSLTRSLLVLTVVASVACVDETETTEICSPIIKFSTPEGVSPSADGDGNLSIPVQVECTEDLAVWAWSSQGDIDVTLDVFEQDGGEGYVVVAPVQSRGDDSCFSTGITVALVDDHGEVIDQDRTYVPYELAD